MKVLSRILFPLLAFSFALQTKADDASAISVDHWTYGHVKSDTPNQQIALEKELMIVTHDSIKAIFVFKNTTNQPVETPCVFPITSVLRLPYEEPHGDSVIFYSSQVKYNSSLWSIALDKKVNIYDNQYGDCFWVDKEDISLADQNLRKFTYTEYLDAVKELTASSYLSGCTILQNGRNVPIENVGIETSLGEENLKMDVYFYHHLKFKPYEVSKVEVAYPIESFEEEYHGCASYKVNYDISSGGTWKGGTINSFVVYSTLTMESESSNPMNKKFGSCQFSDVKVYYKTNYKPQKDDYFIFEGSSCQDYMINYEANDLKARVSDYLKNDSIVGYVFFPEGDLFPTFPKTGKRLPLITNVSSSTKQDVAALFDGNLYTSYVAPASSYIEFELTEPVLGPFVSNGFVANLLNEKIFCAQSIEHEDYDFAIFKDSIWENTSRLKSMTLTKIGTSETYQFSLADKYGVIPNGQKDWLGVNSVYHPQVLRPGRYRLTLDSTYQGTKINAVGLGEIWFYLYPADLITLVDKDGKDSIQIFQDCYQQIEPNWVTGYDFVPYDLFRSQKGTAYQDSLKKYGDEKLMAQMDSLNRYYQECLKKYGSEDLSTGNNNTKYYVLAGVGLLLLVVGGGVFYWFRRKRQNKADNL